MNYVIFLDYYYYLCRRIGIHDMSLLHTLLLHPFPENCRVKKKKKISFTEFECRSFMTYLSPYTKLQATFKTVLKNLILICWGVDNEAPIAIEGGPVFKVATSGLLYSFTWSTVKLWWWMCQCLLGHCTLTLHEKVNWSSRSFNV